MTIEKVEIPKPMKAAKNKHKVPESQWKKWGARGRETFNWLYGLMMDSPDLFSHPKAPNIKPVYWKTVAWNVAWLAADAVADSIRKTK